MEPFDRGAPFDGGGHLDRDGRRAWVAGGDATELCALCARLLPGVSGVSVTVMTDRINGDTVCVSDEVGRRLEEAQFTHGEGPCVDVFTDGDPVLVPDLTEPRWARRWPMFTPAALDAGARAVFVVPLQAGTVRLGVLTAYRDRAGTLSVSERDDLVGLATLVTWALIGERRDKRPEPSHQTRPLRRAVVHQATGMVAVQLATTLDTALTRLRARAFAEGRPIEQVAADVVAGRLTFRDDGDPDEDAC